MIVKKEYLLDFDFQCENDGDFDTVKGNCRCRKSKNEKASLPYNVSQDLK